MTKEQFTQEVKNKKAEIALKIDGLSLKMKESKEHLQSDYAEEIQALKKKKAALEVKYETLKDMAEEKWDDAKESLMESYNSISVAFKNMFK